MNKASLASALVTAISILRFGPPEAVADDGAGAIATADSTPAGTPATSLVTLLDEMTDRVRLAEFPQPLYVSRLFSSSDRASTAPDRKTWHADDDRGHVLRIEERDGRREGVLADIEGPGAVVRIWSANPSGTLRFYLDGAGAPTFVIAMRTWLDGSGPVPAPLSEGRSSGFVSYLPIPFAKRCTITCDEAAGLLYHVSIRSYSATTVIEAFQPAQLEAHAEAIRTACSRLLDPAVPFHYRSRVTKRIAPGEESILFDMAGSAAISEVRLHVHADDLPSTLRTAILIGEFDGKRTVHCPLGDFFGSAPGINACTSRAATIDPDGTLTSRWFMPFADSGRLLLRNVALAADAATGQIEVEGTVGSSEYEWCERSLHFHALWRGECFSTRPPRTFELAAIEGRGVWVGDSLTVGNVIPVWWGEGDDMISIDGEASPSQFGTGTGDYYGCAETRAETFAAPFNGLTRLDSPEHLGFTSLFRWRALDAIPFERSIRFAFEIAHRAETRLCYAGTSFFYAEPASFNVEQIVDPVHLAVPVLDLPRSTEP